MYREWSVSHVPRPYPERRPNTRLKLPAPGRGKNCVCAPAAFVLVSIDVAPADVGAAA